MITAHKSDTVVQIKSRFGRSKIRQANINNIKRFLEPERQTLTVLSNKQIQERFEQIGDLKQPASPSNTNNSRDDQDIDSNNEETYEVDHVLAYQKIGDERLFLVCWKGYDDVSWLHEKEMTNCKEAVADFFASRKLRRLL